MKNSIFICLVFVSGILIGMSSLIPAESIPKELVSSVLYVLIFTVGIEVGANTKVWRVVRTYHWKIALVPVSVIAGTFLGVGFLSVFLSGITLRHALAIGAGFGYYSLSSVIISQLDGEVLGVIALMTNLMREILTLLTAPWAVRVFGKLAPIASGGATSMDVTLPVITKVSGKEYAVISVFSGMILTLLVPILIPILLRG